jgi:hypothetical protein
VEVEVAVAKATRLAVFSYRGLKVIGSLLCAGGDAGEDGCSEETCGNSTTGLSAEKGLEVETEDAGVLAREGETEEGLESAPRP